MRRDPRIPLPAATPSGFTLIEIMAVMAVIAVLLSVAAVGIQNIEKGQATTSAVAVTEALFDEARSTAIGRGSRARLLIHNELNDSDPQDRDRYLRYMIVVALATDDQGNPTNQWEAVSRGTSLPSGVYYSSEGSEAAAQRIKEIGKPGEMQMRLPGDRSPKSCIYYEFNSEGVCVDGESGSADSVKPGGAVVLVSGNRPPDRPEPIVLGDNRVGFVVWRNGRTSLFRHPDQITAP